MSGNNAFRAAKRGLENQQVLADLERQRAIAYPPVVEIEGPEAPLEEGVAGYPFPIKGEMSAAPDTFQMKLGRHLPDLPLLPLPGMPTIREAAIWGRKGVPEAKLTQESPDEPVRSDRSFKDFLLAPVKGAAEMMFSPFVEASDRVATGEAEYLDTSSENPLLWNVTPEGAELGFTAMDILPGYGAVLGRGARHALKVPGEILEDLGQRAVAASPAIAMPIGGRSQIGMLGRRLPKVGDNLFEMAEREGYQIGSAPGVYQHAEKPSAPSYPARLTREESARLSEEYAKWVEQYGKKKADELAKQARQQIIDYRSTHHPKEGFTLAEPSGYEVNVGAFDKQGTPAYEKALERYRKRVRKAEIAGDEIPELPAGLRPPVTVKYKQQAPMFHKNPATGKAWTPEERVDLVEDTSNKIVAEISEYMRRAGQGDRNAQFIIDQSRWYGDAERTIKDLFGLKGSRLYADLQGSMSPNTRLSEQHKMAQEFFERLLDGDFDKQLKLFDAHMANKPPDASPNAWANALFDEKSDYFNPDAIPLKKSGKKYGIHSADAMKAVRDMIGNLEPGMAPKMRNFAANLRGDSVNPTVDVWAGRTINRLISGERVPPLIDKGVPGDVSVPQEMLLQGHYERAQLQRSKEMKYKEKMKAWEAKAERAAAKNQPPPPKPKEPAPSQQYLKDQQSMPSPDTGGQYGIAKDIFNTAAAKLNIPADDLQALMWFLEKEAWEAKGFTNIDPQPSLVELIKRDNPAGSTARLQKLAEQYR